MDEHPQSTTPAALPIEALPTVQAVQPAPPDDSAKPVTKAIPAPTLKTTKPPKAPRQPRNSPITVVAITIVISLLLATLIVYAYMRGNSS